MLDLVGNQDCWFSHAKAQIVKIIKLYYFAVNIETWLLL